MDKGKILKNFADKIPTKTILKTIEELEVIRNMVYVNGSLEDLTNQYLNYQQHLISFNNQIKTIQKDIQTIHKRMWELKHHSITQLKKENKLLTFLSTLSKNDLNQLKQIVDIDNEVNQIELFRLNESKKQRGNTIISM